MPERQIRTLDELALHPEYEVQVAVLRQLTPEPLVLMPHFGVDVRPCFLDDLPRRVVKWLNVEVNDLQELVTCVKLLQVVFDSKSTP